MSTATHTQSPPDGGRQEPVSLTASSPRYGEKAVVGWLFLCAAFSVLVTAGIVVSLLTPTIEFFNRVAPGNFFSAEAWAPFNSSNPGYGVLRLVVGTLNVTLWALLIAIPAGLGAAIYLSEYASRRARKVLKPILEVLEGVPTVAYGVFALTFVTPLLREFWPTFLPGKLGEPPGVFSAASAGIVMGVMIIPTVASISQDAMSAVPSGLRQAAYGLGSTRMQVATKVVVPAALSGIVAGFILGISRAIGETMIVLLAAGAAANLSLWPNDSVLTMTTFIARTSTGDIGHGTTTYYTIFAVGALLFAMTFIMNMISIALVRRFRETYE
ncbi:phosphate ABC transporter permease subunit PstC [Ornithinimicrobium cryptoxanthini]|uniref:Phosphate transport system permease protein n=1 Tax=Ornithinimicrobium cryptoxanthini TaxID=2934161 RepID=A0ABY4YIY0_9MICO|nr:phosphate ABC transporter permease subunit PstC [Ornithinimicrobium cryptoxanthini]USQ76658.1 phosphate ABC transporter permease subunit PstC [Ornithinimicrobium cryptoxanthini]